MSTQLLIIIAIAALAALMFIDYFSRMFRIKKQEVIYFDFMETQDHVSSFVVCIKKGRLDSAFIKMQDGTVNQIVSTQGA